MPCKFCGVLPEYGHFDWCKIDRAPTGDEIARAVIEENFAAVFVCGVITACVADDFKEMP